MKLKLFPFVKMSAKAQSQIIPYKFKLPIVNITLILK